ncbi:beta-ketoacyl-ACP synthase II [Clostridium sp. 'deep sea']|uniref:beta-ketoacyl-ACP synthase II n=1 Tax=Clostridium sp. 'deep sea' TaxID=2779445 RepID=UPI00189691FC|nr:beta-ketoacyl-ACP synthase II [Clostridium sp. 'deep sea']QOR34630.1 beta-ketoacyl-ACP synthase II [Clostridium sp. 'deep sea']
MKRRVVVTGIGIISPVGNDLKSFWQSISTGKNGMDFIKRFDITDFPVKIAAEVKDFDPTEYMGKKDARRMDRFCQFALAAAKQAWQDCKLCDNPPQADRAGVIFGSGIGGLETIEKQALRLNKFGPKKVSPFFIPMSIINMAAGYIAIALNLKGVNSSVQTACATGSTAIGEAMQKIQNNDVDVIVAGGAEATITPLAIAGFQVMNALNDGDNPDRASIPFDKERSGFVMGEGSAALVLESLEHAQARGAKIYGEVVGYGSTADAYHITAPSPEAEGATNAINLALKSADISAKDIGYINAHGTSTPMNDKLETLAIKKAFGDYAAKVPVSSTKSMTGHLLGAAGAVEAAVCLKALQEGILPPTINYQVSDPECDLDYIANEPRKQQIKYALSNSLGFGGHNVTLVFKRWEN